MQDASPHLSLSARVRSVVEPSAGFIATAPLMLKEASAAHHSPKDCVVLSKPSLKKTHRGSLQCIKTLHKASAQRAQGKHL